MSHMCGVERRRPSGLWWAAALLGCWPVAAAAAQVTVAAPTQAATVSPGAETGKGQVLDRVVAIVNGDLILDSDVNEELRLSAFQPYRDTAEDQSRERDIERLVNRALILQQIKLLPQEPVSDEDLHKQIEELRHTIPACQQYDCATDAGWQKFLAAHGFTKAAIDARWRSRMEVLRFIEQRFQLGTRIAPAEIKKFYEQTMLPEYARQHVKPAPLTDELSKRIQEVLLQRQVSSLLGDWLNSLRSQGSVVILKRGEVAP